MTDDLDPLFGELDRSAASLREEVGAIDTVISRANERLAGAGVRAEVWVEERPITRRELSVSASSVAPRIDVQLGFAPALKKGTGAVSEGTPFTLMIREVETVPEPTAGDGDVYRAVRVLEQKSVEEAPIELQLQALERLPDLVRLLTDAVNDQRATLERARKLVE